MAPKLREVCIATAACWVGLALIPAPFGSVAAQGRYMNKTTIESHDVDNYEVVVRRGEEEQVLVSGDGSSDLDLYIFDEDNHLICKDEDETDAMACTWTAPSTEVYQVKVKNRGRANRYVIVTD
jgi:hypothetical protein